MLKFVCSLQPNTPVVNRLEQNSNFGDLRDTLMVNLSSVKEIELRRKDFHDKVEEK